MNADAPDVPMPALSLTPVACSVLRRESCWQVSKALTVAGLEKVTPDPGSDLVLGASRNSPQEANWLTWSSTALLLQVYRPASATAAPVGFARDCLSAARRPCRTFTFPRQFPGALAVGPSFSTTCARPGATTSAVASRHSVPDGTGRPLQRLSPRPSRHTPEHLPGPYFCSAHPPPSDPQRPPRSQCSASSPCGNRKACRHRENRKILPPGDDFRLPPVPAESRPAVPVNQRRRHPALRRKRMAGAAVVLQ